MRKLILGVLVLAAVVGAWLLLRPPEAIDPLGATDARGVLLIPGYGGDASSLSALAADLGSAGYAVAVADIGDGQGDLAGYARTVQDNIRELEKEGGGSVHLVGFSAGGVIARLALSEAPDLPVGRIVTLGSPHYGTTLASVGAAFAPEECPIACQQLARDSELLSGLPVAGSEEKWLAVYTPSDSVVRPIESAILEGATALDIEGYCSQRGQEVQHGDLPTAAGISAVVSAFFREGKVPPAGTGC